ncbi:Uncharacterized protein TCM_005307 [Theobroma cacao]|uniref:Uncharacterized protein n=1 Tax=Theobroma cacao TaxID=3641 RepID=A0A061DT64_THECC|nr:Uncharacterized protein TCM_005307 [Theobroma cacao]
MNFITCQPFCGSASPVYQKTEKKPTELACCFQNLSRPRHPSLRFQNESTVIAKINSQAKVHDTYKAEIKEELCCDECNGKFDEEGIPIHNDPIGVDEVPVEGDAASSGAKDVSTKGFDVQIDCNDFLPSDLQRKKAKKPRDCCSFSWQWPKPGLFVQNSENPFGARFLELEENGGYRGSVCCKPDYHGCVKFMFALALVNVAAVMELAGLPNKGGLKLV